MSLLQDIFSKNQNPGQSCRPSIDLTAVLKQKIDKDFKKLLPNVKSQSNIEKFGKALCTFEKDRVEACKNLACQLSKYIHAAQYVETNFEYDFGSQKLLNIFS